MLCANENCGTHCVLLFIILFFFNSLNVVLISEVVTKTFFRKQMQVAFCKRTQNLIIKIPKQTFAFSSYSVFLFSFRFFVRNNFPCTKFAKVRITKEVFSVYSFCYFFFVADFFYYQYMTSLKLLCSRLHLKLYSNRDNMVLPSVLRDSITRF